jgi:energy-coupling factor transporter ATP-binding protein EcfA2
MRITKIEVKDFRAFRGEYCIRLSSSKYPSGKNLLLYGENGSGKSSLFQALNLFFAPPTSFSNHKNIFVHTDDGYVKLEIGMDRRSAKIYEWEEASHPFSESLIVEASKAKGFLDYRALLDTHFVHRHTEHINIFNLLINTLLANIPNPITQTNFPEELQTIEEIVKSRKSKRRTEQLEQLIPDFNAGLSRVLDDLTGKTNELLAPFEQAVTIALTLPDEGMSVDDEAKLKENQAIYLTATYYGSSVSRHHHFLNEARLSAIAISIYLSALLLVPPAPMRVLFLDDVLIGLDMSNRLPLLDVLATHFADWQIILTTYDKVWYEMARRRIDGWQPAWVCTEFYTAQLDEGDIPIHAPDNDYLVVAEKHLSANDLKAAAIYIRSAYEHEIKRFCNKHNLSVRYCRNPKDQRSDDFWQVVKKQKWNDGTDVVPPALVTNIELYRATVLNQLSHTAPVTLARREVVGAQYAVNNLRNKLRRNGKLQR